MGGSHQYSQLMEMESHNVAQSGSTGRVHYAEVPRNSTTAPPLEEVAPQGLSKRSSEFYNVDSVWTPDF